MITFNTDELLQFESDLKTFADRAYPFATKSTVNTTAFQAQTFARQNIKQNMINRNAFTRQSVQVNKAFTLDVSAQYATIGSTEDYMERQEFGGVNRDPMIATSVSAGQSRKANPRRRAVKRPNRLGTLRWSSRKSKYGAAGQVRQAAAKKTRFIYLKTRRTEGVFRVTGSARKPKLDMMYDTSRSAVSIPANPWLQPAVKQVTPLIPGFYRDALMFQLKRNNLFRG